MEDVEKKYQDALDFLYSFIDYSLKRNFRNAAEKFNLERMRNFMHHLGDPHQDYRIIHVAGTKGKGSVSAFCANVLAAQGYKTGLYTSPHMVEFTERIRINGQDIPKDALVEIVDILRPVTEKVQEITTFELMTALAFVYFSQHDVDVVQPGIPASFSPKKHVPVHLRQDRAVYGPPCDVSPRLRTG